MDVSDEYKESYLKSQVILRSLSPFGENRLVFGADSAVEFTKALSRRLLSAGFGVLFVPHCSPQARDRHDNDLNIHTPAFERLKMTHPNAVGKLPNGIDFHQVKYAIGKCIAFEGARMHSTITAWSSGEPVVSLCYSAKSRHLNQAIYGHERYITDLTSAKPERLAFQLQYMINELEAREQTTQGVNRRLADATRTVESLRKWERTIIDLSNIS